MQLPVVTEQEEEPRATPVDDQGREQPVMGVLEEEEEEEEAAQPGEDAEDEQAQPSEDIEQQQEVRYTRLPFMYHSHMQWKR